MIALLLLVAAAERLSIDQRPVHVDFVELNTVCDDEGNARFTQLIFRRWEKFDNVFSHWVAEWTIVKSVDARRMANGKVFVRWTSDGQRFCVTARSFMETRTNGDPEQLEQNLRPTHRRNPYGIINQEARAVY